MNELLIQVTSIFNYIIRHDLKIQSIERGDNSVHSFVFIDFGDFFVDVCFNLAHPPQIEKDEKNLYKVAYIITSNLWNIHQIQIEYPNKKQIELIEF